jgi:hypothetical protein
MQLTSRVEKVRGLGLLLVRINNPKQQGLDYWDRLLLAMADFNGDLRDAGGVEIIEE